jgi:hypothetical protein
MAFRHAAQVSKLLPSYGAQSPQSTGEYIIAFPTLRTTAQVPRSGLESLQLEIGSGNDMMPCFRTFAPSYNDLQKVAVRAERCLRREKVDKLST